MDPSDAFQGATDNVDRIRDAGGGCLAPGKLPGGSRTALCPEAPDGSVFAQIWWGRGGRAPKRFILLGEGLPFLRVIQPQGSL